MNLNFETTNDCSGDSDGSGAQVASQRHPTCEVGAKLWWKSRKSIATFESSGWPKPQSRKVTNSHKQKPRNGEKPWNHIISGHDPVSCSGAAMESESYQWWFLPVQRSKGLPCQVETTPRLSNHVLDHWWNVVSNDARPFGGENRSHS